MYNYFTQVYKIEYFICWRIKRLINPSMKNMAIVPRLRMFYHHALYLTTTCLRVGS